MRYNPAGRSNFGIHFDVVEAAPDGSWATVHVYRYALDYEFTADKDFIEPPEEQNFTFTATNVGTATGPEPANFAFDLPETLDLDVFEANYGDLGWYPATRQLRWTGFVMPGQPLEINFKVNALGASTVRVTAEDGAGVTDTFGWMSAAKQDFQQSVSPEDYTGTRDTYIDLWTPDTNYGYAQVMLSRQQNIKKMLVKFEGLMDYIPAGAQVMEARLWLTTRSSTNPHWQEVKVAPALTGWDFASTTWNQAAAGIPWNTPGGDYGDAVDMALVDQTGDYSWDVTGVVQDWIDGVYPDYGFVLYSESQAGSVEWRFTSSIALAVGDRPALEITYILP